MSTFADRHIAERCVCALSEIAERIGVLPEVQRDFESLQRALATPELRTVLANCRASVSNESRAAQCLIDVLDPSPLMVQFLGFVVEQRLLVFLEEIVHWFLAFTRTKEGYKSLTFFTAAPLEESAIAALTSQLQEALGQKIDPTFTVDSTLLSGFKVRVGSKTVDFSFRSHLKHLKNELEGAHP
ncbi:MAG: ATP synthase F1 subunit delta [Holosporales bacterium]|nr:ATP synthase F1 subunit delta [Holosporales bacterium]